jgi:hypothetical protein
MDSQILFTKNENGTLDRVLGISSNTLLTTNKNLSQLSDVNTTGVSTGKALVYDNATQKWIAGGQSFTQLSDVLINESILNASNSIKWSPALNKWSNRDLGYAIMTISGRLKDSLFNTNDVNFNLLNPNSYELDNEGNTTFSISSFTNNSINVDTTTNFNINGLLNGANYRIEYNFNYYYSTGSGFITLTTFNQVPSQIGFTLASVVSTSRIVASSQTLASNTLNSISIQAKLGSGTVVGLTPTNLNLTISVIEM